MSGGRSGGRRRPYWLLSALVALAISAPPALTVAMLAAAIVLQTTIHAVIDNAAEYAGRAASAAGAAQGVLLGSDARGEAVLLSDRQLSAHALILGASGAGKSTTLLALLTDRVRRGGAVVAIDLKGSPAFARELAHAAAEAGRRFCLWSPDGPGQWNPLRDGNATELKDKLICTERFTEPHYQRAAERYVQTALQVLIATQPGRAPTLAQAIALMEPRRLTAAVRNAPRPLAERVQDYVSSLTSDQLSAIRGLGTRLAIMGESHTGGYLLGGGAQEIDLRAALAGEQVVLFSLNSSSYGQLAAQLGTLAVQDLITAVGSRLGPLDAPGEPRSDRPYSGLAPALIGIDEFSALGADNVVALLARGREAGVSVLLATQELADLDRAGRGLRDQVLGNTAVKIAHRQDVPASAQTIAQMIGTEPAWEQTFQTSAGGLLGRRDTGRGTRRAVERFIIHPNQIKALPTGQAVLITKLPVASARTVRVRPARSRDGLERD